MPHGSYTGRFAPSPTGPLHAGSVATALASWLDARAAQGRWLVRMEDLDQPRCIAGADAVILGQLQALGLVPDEPVTYQSRRQYLYQAALERLRMGGWTYPCGCTRKAIDDQLAAAGQEHARHGERVYPGTCRHGLGGRSPRAVRLRVDADGSAVGIAWTDRRLGALAQDVAAEVGDFVLWRADGVFAYQLAVVVDDAEQGVSDIVRGEDLADNTPRQILLQQRLGLPTPRYLHTPLVYAADGQKLSKQTGAAPVGVDNPLVALRAAGRVLGLDAEASDTAAWREAAVAQWRERWRVKVD